MEVHRFRAFDAYQLRAFIGHQFRAFVVHRFCVFVAHQFRARSMDTSSARFLRSRPVHSTWTQMAGAPSRGTGHL
ncbi:hypothetical protein EB836_08110 [Brevibacterium sp. S111]|nr:hypothetical protein EB836_08110 [Brevibacterium sp. S111]